MPKISLRWVVVLVGLCLLPQTVWAAGTASVNKLVFFDCRSVGLTVTATEAGAYPLSISSNTGYSAVITVNLVKGEQGVNLSFEGQPAGSKITVQPIGNTTAGRFDYICESTVAGAFDPSADADQDGVQNRDDNCLTVSNRDQANSWGASGGDACDRDFYENAAVGVKAFKQTSGEFKIFGNCQNSRCGLIATLKTSDLTAIKLSNFRRFASSDSQWAFVNAYFLGEEGDGSRIYQVNVYNAGGELVDDRLLIIITSSGNTLYRPR